MSPGPQDYLTVSEITITSFGYLHGQPPTAHLTVDLRAHFLDPDASPALRHLTARDQEVRNAVLDTAGIVPLIEATAAMARAYTSGPSADQHPLHIAVGCAGGRHRAPTVAAELQDLLSLDGYTVRLAHRDLAKPVAKHPAPTLNPDYQALDAEAYVYLRNVLRSTMADPDHWDGEGSESWILGQYIYWLAAGQPVDEDGFPDHQNNHQH
jgi:hypothetical protein